MKTLKLLLCLVCIHISTLLCWGMEESRNNERPLTLITKGQRSFSPYHVVFDMHHTLCTPGWDKKKHYPEGCSLSFYHQESNRGSSKSSWFFYLGFGELFLTLLEWGWHVDFFSSEEQHKTEVMIPAYLKTALSPYSQDIDTEYAALRQRGEFNTFSYHHLSYEKGRKYIKPYAMPGDYVKDLTCIGDVQNIILVDDDRTYVPEDQYPFILMSFCKSYNFSNQCLGKNAERKTDSDPFPLNNAAYVLGILFDCKQILGNTPQMSLRQALDAVLKDPDATGTQSPWILWRHPQQKRFITQATSLSTPCVRGLTEIPVKASSIRFKCLSLFFKSNVQNTSLF